MRAGVWARSVCLNENLEKGSMMPLIEASQRNNMSVLVMNPNLKVDPKMKVPIRYCRSMEVHCSFVWEKYVLNSKF